MARKKKGFDYFAALVALADKTAEAGQELLKIVEDYHLEQVVAEGQIIHRLENEGDEIVHEIMLELDRSFITPIDREDIMLITEQIDDVLDGINAITYQFDNFLISEMRPKTTEIVSCIVEATTGLAVVTQEFSKFKHSKKLKEMIIHVNTVEGRGNILYNTLVKELFSKEKDVLEVIKWKELYRRFEEVIDMSEKAVNVLAGLVIKNN